MPKRKSPSTTAEFHNLLGSLHRILPVIEAATPGDGAEAKTDREIFDETIAYRDLDNHGRQVEELSTIRCFSNRSMMRVFHEAGTEFPRHITSHNAECLFCSNFLGGFLRRN